MEALAITPDSHVVTIASGGCNVLSYLTADPAKIPAAVESIISLLGKISGDQEAVRRWMWLASFLNTYYFEFTRQNRVERAGRVELDVF